MDLFVPAEFIQGTTIKIGRDGEILDLTDEESPRYKEVFLRIDGKKQVLDLSSNHVVASFTDRSSIQVALTTGGTASLVVQNGALSSDALGTFHIALAPPSFCCGGGGTTYDVTNDSRRVANCRESSKTQSLQVEFFEKDPKEKLVSFLLILHDLYFN